MSGPALWPVLAAGGALFGYAAGVEPRRFEVTWRELPLPRWPDSLDGFTILHLTDFHSRGPGPLEAFVAGLPALVGEPDLIALTGDFAETDAGLSACLASLAPLRARYGMFAALGNNDLRPRRRLATVMRGLAALDVRVLGGESVRIETDRGAFLLGGLLYYWVRRIAHRFVYPVGQVFAAAGDEPRVLLCHTPDAVPEAAAAGVELMLAGHTHGGQVCLPGGRPLRNHLYRFEPGTYDRGLYRIDGMALYVNRGLGVSGWRLRTWCRPEAALLTLRAGDRTG